MKNCYYCGNVLSFDKELGIFVCSTKDCKGSADSIRRGAGF